MTVLLSPRHTKIFRFEKIKVKMAGHQLCDVSDLVITSGSEYSDRSDAEHDSGDFLRNQGE